MVAVEVVLILIGVAFLVGSFFVTEKLSQQDLEQISLMSEADLKVIAEKQVEEVKSQVESSVEEIIDESLEITKRGLEKETNNKIMAVSEYSDTVLENINKAHNEIMFLHSMLNDKQAETAEMVSDLQRVTKQVREMDIENTLSRVETQAASVEPEEMDDEFIDNMNESAEAILNKNEQILLLHKEGKDEVEIAKTLDCGLGEVRLVLGLYHEA